MSSFKIVLEQEYGEGPSHYFLNAKGKHTDGGIVPVYDKSGGTEITFESTGEKGTFYLKSGGNYLGVSPTAGGVYPHTKEMFSPLAFTVLPSLAKDKPLFQFLLEDISDQFGVVLRNLGTDQLLSYVGENPYFAALVHYNIGIMRLVQAGDHTPVNSVSHFKSLVNTDTPSPTTADSGSGGTTVIPVYPQEPFKLTKAAIIGIVVCSILLILLIIFLILKFK
jgi:hypothetical protein